jgi:hypothetical protein
VKKTSKNNKYMIVHNKKNIGVTMPIETTSTLDPSNTPQDRSYQRFFSLASFVWGLAKNVGLFFFGIFLGLGIVLRDPPPDKKNLAIIEQLKDENKTLKASLKNQEVAKPPVFGEIKNGVVIGR